MRVEPLPELARFQGIAVCPPPWFFFVRGVTGSTNVIDSPGRSVNAAPDARRAALGIVFSHPRLIRVESEPAAHFGTIPAAVVEDVLDANP